MPKKRKFSQADGLKAVAWAQNWLGLQAWSIEIDVSDDSPEWVEDGDAGACFVHPECEEATIWIGPERIKESRFEAIEVVFHELVHVTLHKAGLSHEDQATVHFERVCNRFAEILRALYECGQR